MKMWWNSLPARSRVAFVAGVAGVVTLAAAAAWWLLRPEPAVLFSDLRPQDAAALSSELEKLKIPYSVADNGATLLVDRAQVHAARLKLMGRDVPLHGTVGLELFNTTDFGMTEFAQKINFQRALQGELTRTILSFPEIRDARVHLVLPDQGLFRQNAARAKAAITLGLRPGHALRSEQVLGIQRLVAAAVPALSPQEVTIVDQQGLPLTRPGDGEAEGTGAGQRLDLKRETEQYLARKATALLEQAFGPGQALASVDVTLNMDSVRTTTEDVIPASDGRGNAGVLVRERETARDSLSPDGRNPEARGARGSSMQRDAEYQTGRRVEQVVSQPGAIRRIQVVAVVREPLAEEQQRHLERVIAAAVGVASERGDTVVVQTLRPATAVPVQALDAERAPAAAPGVEAARPWILALAAGACMLLVGIAAALAARRKQSPMAPPLSEQQRRATLERVQTWMLEAHAEAASVPARTGGSA